MIPTIDDVEGLLAILRSPAASAHDGEPVSIVEHSLQCAAILRVAHPEDEALQVAGLVHDLGTVLEPDHPERHAATGAGAVRPLLGGRVGALVADHDRAKRYLVAVDTTYRSQLTGRSIETLAVQGGPLGDVERATFERSPHLDACLALRRADDHAKTPGIEAGAVDDWRAVAERVSLDGSTRRAAR